MKQVNIPKQRKIEFDLRIALDPQTILRMFQSTPLLQDYWRVLEHQEVQIVNSGDYWKLYFPYLNKYSLVSTVFFNAYSIDRTSYSAHAAGWLYYAGLVWCCKSDDFWERFNKTAPKLDKVMRNLHFYDDAEWDLVKNRVADLSLLWLATSINNGKVPWKSRTMGKLIHISRPNLIYYLLIRTGIAKVLWIHSREHTIYLQINEDLDEDLWVDIIELNVKGLNALRVGKRYKGMVYNIK